MTPAASVGGAALPALSLHAVSHSNPPNGYTTPSPALFLIDVNMHARRDAAARALGPIHP